MEITTYQPGTAKAHILGMRGYDQQVATFKAYKGALLMLRGAEDSTRHEDEVFSFQAQPAEFRIIKGADHIFNVLDLKSTYDENVLNATNLAEHYFTHSQSCHGNREVSDMVTTPLQQAHHSVCVLNTLMQVCSTCSAVPSK